MLKLVSLLNHLYFDFVIELLTICGENDNLRNEYSDLFSDVPKDIAFARIALQKQPDAVNFWLGKPSTSSTYYNWLKKKRF